MYTVTIYVNHSTKAFSVSKRTDTDPVLKDIAVAEAARGYTAFPIATGLDDAKARALKGNTMTSLEEAGYSKVTRPLLKAQQDYLDRQAA